MTPSKTPDAPLFTSDLKLGVLGGCLAVASAAFGAFMMIHGPVSGFGKTGGFSVFAQLAATQGRGKADGGRDLDDLDMTATATIPTRRGDGDPRPINIQRVSADSAVLLVNGQARTVHIGDIVAGWGEILGFIPGDHGYVRTSRGVFASSSLASAVADR